MNERNDETTPYRRNSGAISLEDRLENIEDKLDRLLLTSGDMQARVALIESKLGLHHNILMGACGLILLSVFGALIALVVTK